MDNTKCGVIMRTPEQILAELRQRRSELDATTDETRAVMAIMTVERIEQRVVDLTAEMRAALAKIERRGQKLEIYIRSRNSGDKQANAVYESLMKELEEGK